MLQSLATPTNKLRLPPFCTLLKIPSVDVVYEINFFDYTGNLLYSYRTSAIGASQWVSVPPTADIITIITLTFRLRRPRRVAFVRIGVVGHVQNRVA